jgi:hypothetical protein
MKSREQMVEELKAMARKVSAACREVADDAPEQKASLGGTLGGLLMALQVVCHDEPVELGEALQGVRDSVDAVKADRRARAS